MLEENQTNFNKWQAEQTYLAEQKKLHPQLFERKEGEGLKVNEQLSRIGIVLPFPPLGPGFIKFYPYDFIVEEIKKDGNIVSVDYAEASIPDNPGPFLCMDLVKIGASTIDVVREIATLLKIKDTQVGYGGIKDAIALTSQRISLSGIKKENLAQLPRANYFLKNFQYQNEAISMNSIQGNRFTILMRTKDSIDENALKERIDMLVQEGFWNFYWLQRFGNRLLSHWWGLLLLQGKEERVIRSYLCDPGPNELPFFAELRKKANEKFEKWEEIVELYKPFPFTMRNELFFLNYLKEYRHDYVGALRSLPEQTKLWLQSYASFLYNKVLSFYAQDPNTTPQSLPLILSADPKDHEIYKKFLEKDNITNNFIQKIRRWDFIRLMSRKIQTRIIPIIHDYKITPEGLVISFDLPKGVYATAFLSQIFTLDGSVANDVSTQQIDPKEILGSGSIEETKKTLKDFTVLREIPNQE